MLTPGRQYSATNSYRYGFNGKENDNEVKGEGDQQDYGMRVYDPRLGKFFSVDPLGSQYPWNSAYAFSENDVIRSIDLDGTEKHVRTFAYAVSNGETISKVISNDYKQPKGTFNPYHSWVGGPITTEEIVADGFVRANKLPKNGTFNFFVFSPDLAKKNYARYDYTDATGKPQSTYFDAGYIDFMFQFFEKEQEDANKILNVTGAVVNLIGAGSLAKSEFKAITSDAEALGGSRDINPLKGKTNCAGCTVAGDASLKGFPASALNHGVTTVKDFFSWFGGTKGITTHTSTESIVQMMNKMKDGATGVIFGDRGPGEVGHFFNVVKRNGMVQFVDFQLGVGERTLNPNTLMKNQKFIQLYFKNTTNK